MDCLFANLIAHTSNQGYSGTQGRLRAVFVDALFHTDRSITLSLECSEEPGTILKPIRSKYNAVGPAIAHERRLE